MFIRILEESTHLDPNILSFKRYLERHIELDGNEHGDIALKLIQSLCGDSSSKWEEARQGAHSAIMARIRLYDEVYLTHSGSNVVYQSPPDFYT